MGIFSDFGSINAVAKIKSGGTADISISQITNLIINLPDAKKNLKKEQFEQVYILYKGLRTCKTKLKLDMFGYIDTAIKIIEKFDEIAPYEKYSGGNELEFSFFMQDIRNRKNQSNNYDGHEIVLTKEEVQYADNISKEAVEKGINITRNDAEEIVKVVCIFSKFGKEKALEKLYDFLDILFSEKKDVTVIIKISYLVGVLVKNGVISDEESKNITNKYLNIIKENLLSKQ